MKRFLGSLMIAMLVISGHAFADGSQVASLTLEKIMADPDWLGNAPEDPWFSPDGSMVFYEQKRQGQSTRDWYMVDAGGGNPELIPPVEHSEVPGSGQVWNAARDALAWIFDGDVYVHSMTGASTRQLTRTAATESSPVFLNDARSLAYKQGNDWFAFDFASGETRQLTQVLAEDDPADKEPDGYLQEQQLRLFDTLRRDRQERLDQKAEEQATRAKDPRRMPTPVYIGKDKAIVYSVLSPDGNRLLLVTAEKDRKRGQQDKMPRFVAESGYVDIEDVRSLVGTGERTNHQFMIVDLAGRETHDIDLAKLPGIKDDPLAWLKNKDEKSKNKKDAKPRPVITMGTSWSDDGSALALQVQSADNKDRWLAMVNFEKYEMVSRHRLTDEAWINWDYNEFGWVPGRNDLLWLASEESGYSHLYTVGAARGKAKALTSGKWVAKYAVPSPDGAYLYFSGNRTHPGEYEIYRVPMAGGEVEQLTTLSGLNTFQLSPEGDKLLIVHSEHLRHPDLWVQATSAGAQATRLTDTMSDAYKSIDWVEPKVVPVPSSHVKEPIYSKLYVPRDFDASKILSGRDVCARGRLHAELRLWLALLFSRTDVPHPADARRLHRAGYGFSRLARLRPRLAHGHLSADGPSRSRRSRRRRQMARRKLQRRSQARGRLWRFLRRLPDLYGHVPAPAVVRGGCLTATSDRLGALQPWLHLEHTKHARGGSGCLCKKFTYRVCRRPGEPAAHLPRHAG